jgi:hypothetical protein
MAEAGYALSHPRSLGPGPDRKALDRLRADAKQLPAESGRTLNDVLDRYDLAMPLIDVTYEIILEFDKALKLLPSSDWTRKLQPMPLGSELSGRKILVLDENPQRYYDVVKGGYLTKEEIEGAR